MINEADDKPRLPLIGEQVVQNHSAVTMTVVEFCPLSQKVRLRPCFRKSFKVELEGFWDNYTPSV